MQGADHALRQHRILAKGAPSLAIDLALHTHVGVLAAALDNPAHLVQVDVQPIRAIQAKIDRINLPKAGKPTTTTADKLWGRKLLAVAEGETVSGLALVLIVLRLVYFEAIIGFVVTSLGKITSNISKPRIKDA